MIESPHAHRRIVVTGANGFIGANVALALANRGDAVIHVDDYLSIRGECADGQHKPAELRYPRTTCNAAVYVDYRDLPDWLVSQKTHHIDAIIHLGACSDTTVTDRDWVMGNNVEYTRTLWRWCAAARRPFIYASSAATYGDGAHGYDDDVDPAGYQPLNLYGESKQRFDLWALEQTRNEADHNATNDTGATHHPASPPRWAGLKYFNVYGPREAHKGRMGSVVQHAYHQIRKTGRVKLFQSHREGIADGDQRRDFVFVEDAVKLTLYFLDTPPSPATPNGLYNGGTGVARTFADLARAVFDALGREPRIDYIPMPEDLRGRYQYFTQATTAKLRRAGYPEPFHSVEAGVGAYVAWLERRAVPEQCCASREPRT